MYRYSGWVKVSQYQTANVEVKASSDHQAFLILEAQYGKGNVLNWSRIYEDDSSW